MATIAPKASRDIDAANSTRQGLSSFDRRVLDLVDQIPSGRVMTYGSIAEWLQQGSPRLVARVMSTKSDPDTPWQRVLRADGTCAPVVAAEQERLLRAEGVPFIAGGNASVAHVDLRLAFWQPG